MVFLLGAAGIVPARADSRLPDLVETITANLAGRTGFAAQLLGGDTIIALNGNETFPMASATRWPSSARCWPWSTRANSVSTR